MGIKTDVAFQVRGQRALITWELPSVFNSLLEGLMTFRVRSETHSKYVTAKYLCIKVQELTCDIQLNLESFSFSSVKRFPGFRVHIYEHE